MFSNLLALAFALELGVVPTSEWIMHETDYTYNDTAMYVMMDAEVEITDYLFVGGSIRTEMMKNSFDQTFAPISDQYIFRAGARIGILEIGYRHLCTHPVFAYVYQQEERPQVNYEGNYDEFYLRISGRFDPSSSN